MRDRSIKALSRFLGSRDHISDLNLARLWKGLYYCAWSGRFDRLVDRTVLADLTVGWRVARRGEPAWPPGMWLADKPPFQQELAVRLAQLTHTLRGENGLRFMRIFWETMRREWNGVDHYRYLAQGRSPSRGPPRNASTLTPCSRGRLA